MYLLETGYDAKGPDHLDKCGQKNDATKQIRTREELEEACTADPDCFAYTTSKDQNIGTTAKNGFYPWCLKTGDGPIHYDLLRSDKINFYRKYKSGSFKIYLYYTAYQLFEFWLRYLIHSF